MQSYNQLRDFPNSLHELSFKKPIRLLRHLLLDRHKMSLWDVIGFPQQPRRNRDGHKCVLENDSQFEKIRKENSREETTHG